MPGVFDPAKQKTGSTKYLMILEKKGIVIRFFCAE